MQSAEFSTFVRPNPELREKDGVTVETQKQLEQLPEQSIEELSQRIKSATCTNKSSLLRLTSADMEQM